METQFNISVPFLRLTELKSKIEVRRRWHRLDDTWSYFEAQWQPKRWVRPARFLFFRQRVEAQFKEPLQRDLFTPVSYGFEYSVVVTNKDEGAQDVLHFRHGRSSQESIIGEVKAASQIDYIPSGAWNGGSMDVDDERERGSQARYRESSRGPMTGCMKRNLW